MHTNPIKMIILRKTSQKPKKLFYKWPKNEVLSEQAKEGQSADKVMASVFSVV